MSEVQLDSFEDAFGNTVKPGDEVVYTLGDHSSKRLVRGVVEKIGRNDDRYYNKNRYYIRPTADPMRYGRHKDDTLSPMEIKERIMKI